MADIIFQYFPGETNWLNKEWARAKRHERIQRDIMFAEREFSNLTQKQRAVKIGMTRPAYIYWKNKLNL